jgi:uncharacterized membrane protein YeaQ/YmgE (transglycosylase-associated protein family)
VATVPSDRVRFESCFEHGWAFLRGEISTFRPDSAAAPRFDRDDERDATDGPKLAGLRLEATMRIAMFLVLGLIVASLVFGLVVGAVTYSLLPGRARRTWLFKSMAIGEVGSLMVSWLLPEPNRRGR